MSCHVPDNAVDQQKELSLGQERRWNRYLMNRFRNKCLSFKNLKKIMLGNTKHSDKVLHEIYVILTGLVKNIWFKKKKILEVHSRPEGLSRIYQSKLRRMSLPEIGELEVLSLTSENVSESMNWNSNITGN